MRKKVIPIEDWLNTFRSVADDFAQGSMRFDERAVGDEADDGVRPGAYIAILSEQNSVHLGLSAAPAEIRALARGLLGLRRDESLSEKDVVDGVSEVMNILAGKVKSQMAGRDGQLQLGLPMFITTPIQGGGDMETASAEVKMGPVECRLLVYRRKRAA